MSKTAWQEIKEDLRTAIGELFDEHLTIILIGLMALSFTVVLLAIEIARDKQPIIGIGAPSLEATGKREFSNLFTYSKNVAGFDLTEKQLAVLIDTSIADGTCPILSVSGGWIYTDYGCLKQWVEQVGKREM